MSASSDLTTPPRFLHKECTGEGEDAPKEWQSGRILLPGVAIADWASIKLSLQGKAVDVRLEMIAGVQRVCASWGPAGAGTWRVRIDLGVEAQDHLIVVKPSKLSMVQYHTMVADLERWLPASIAIGLDRLGAFEGVRWLPPGLTTLEQELTQVCHAIRGSQGLPGLVAVLGGVARHPHRILAREERWTRVERARRPVTSRLAAALTRPGNALASGMPVLVVDGMVTPSFDTYENRIIKTFADAVDRRLRRLEWAAEQCKEFEKNRGYMLRQLREAFRRARFDADILDTVGSLSRAPDRITQVLLRHPAYRDGLKGYLRFRRSARIEVDPRATDAAIRDLPSLYEEWGTLTVIDELIAAAEDAGWRVAKSTLVRRDKIDPFVITLKSGTVLILANGWATAALLYQTTFSPGATDLHSISLAQNPDLVLDVQDTAGRRTLHVFDPKYKLSDPGKAGPVKDDIDKMHAYRDSIRTKNGDRVVGSAAILYPGYDYEFKDGIAALSCLPGSAHRLLRTCLSEALRTGATDLGWSQYEVAAPR